MPGEVGEAVFKLTLDKSQFDRGMAGAQGTAAKVGGNIGKLIRKGSLVGAAGLAAVGVAALKFAGDFDDAFDKIRVGTGATGEAFEGLKDDFKAVLSDVPASMADVGTAISDLNTRLGLTGEPLQDLSRQVLELSRITGEDLATNIDAVTRVFGDWQVAADDQGAALDTLFRISQGTGVAVGELGALAVQYGAPMRQFGFSFEETAALLGRFQKEGVNTELVMGSFRIAIGKFAREGKPLRQGLEETIARIQELGPSAESTALAMEIFGARAGADMADTILGGKLAVEDLDAVIAGSGDTILAVGKETMDWRERLTQLKNKVLVALEPHLTKLFEGLSKALTKLIPLVETKLIPWLEKNIPVAIAKMKKAWEDIRPTVEALWKAFKSGLEVVWPIVKGFFNWVLKHKPALIIAIAAIGTAIVVALGPGAIAVAAIVGLITLIGLLRDNWGKIADAIVSKATWLKDQFLRPIEFLKNMLAQHWKEIVTVALMILFPVGGGLFALVTNSFGIRDKIIGIFVDLKDKMIETFGVLATSLAFVWESIKGTGKAAANAYIGYINALIVAIEKAINAVAKVINAIPAFKVPGWVPGIGGKGFEIPNIPTVSIPRVPTLHAGGVVPGRPGQETLAVLEAGERILSAAEAGRGGGSEFNVNVSGFGDFEDMKRRVLAAVSRLLDEEATRAGIRSPLVVQGVGVPRL